MTTSETPEQTTSDLRITDVKLLHLRTTEEIGGIEPAWDLGGAMRFQVGGGSFVEIHTNEGITGIGTGMADIFLPKVRDLLIGADPFQVEQHAAALQYYVKDIPYNGRAGVDIALWDIIGKACGQPRPGNRGRFCRRAACDRSPACRR